MRALELKVPPPLVAALAAGLMLLLDHLVPQAAPDVPFPMILAAVLAATGLLITVLALRFFRRAGTTANPFRPSEASALVERGIYRLSRNPMYLGLALMLLGLAVFLRNPIALAGPALLVLYLTRFQIIPEERILSEKFGEAYDMYKARVRRWI